MKNLKLSNNAQTFSSASAWGFFFLGFFFIALFEMIALSALLFSWSKTAASVHLVFSLLTLVWLLKNYRDVLKNPSVVDDEFLWVRSGPFFNFSVPMSNVQSVTKYRRQPQFPSDCVNMAPVGDPELMITFKDSVQIPTVFRLKHSTLRVGVTFDDSTAFQNALTTYIQKNELIAREKEGNA